MENLKVIEDAKREAKLELLLELLTWTHEEYMKLKNEMDDNTDTLEKLKKSPYTYGKFIAYLEVFYRLQDMRPTRR